MKLKVAVIFGSRTCEHDVSIISAVQAIENLNREEYDVVPVYIARDGQWYTGNIDIMTNTGFYFGFRPDMLTRVAPVMSDDSKLTLVPFTAISPHGFKGMMHVLLSNMNLGEEAIIKCDVVLPVMHGMNGEDGTLQGLLELYNVPYASTSVLGSSLGMDKIAMKQYFRGLGLPVVNYTWFTRAEWNAARDEVLARVESELSWPMFVKPANLGSSIGISRATDRESLIHAVNVAAEYDKRILVEQGLEKPVEVNCSALRVKDEVRASLCEMPVSSEEMLTFYEKYLRQGGGKSAKGGPVKGAPVKGSAPVKGAHAGSASGGMESLARKVPAPISDELTQRIQQMTARVYSEMDCKGVVRIDYMLDGDSLYINEINIIPGSLAYYLWEPLGINFSKLLDIMLEDAFNAHAEKNRSVFSYDSSILSAVRTGGTKGGAKAGRGTKG